MGITLTRATDPAIAWLNAFAEAVQTRDLAAGRHLFAPDAAGFGTVTDVYSGIDQLVHDQWTEVWPRTTCFTVDAVVGRWSSADGETIAVLWHSKLADFEKVRRGRATFHLRWSGQQLVAVHSHFSMLPGTAS